MAKTVTRSDLRTAVRNRGEFLEPYFTDTEINNYINISLSHLYDIIIASDTTYFLTQSDINITSGTRSYALPSDFYKCVGVALYAAAATDGYYTLDTFNFDERWDNITLDADRDTRYEIRGSNIIFHPTPTFSGKAILEYIPTPTELSDDVTTWDSINLWTEWVILDVLITCAGKEESDPSVWMALKEKTEQRIMSMGKRNISSPKTTRGSNSLRDLRHNIRNRGGWTHEQVGDNQLTSWINSSISAFVDLVSKHDPAYYLSRSDVSVVSGTNEYSLPSDLYKLHGVAVEDSSKPDGYDCLDRFNFDERYDYYYLTEKSSTRYMVRGSNIIFHPTPTWSGTVRLEYIPVPTALSNATDTFTFYNGWEEWVILDVCVKVSALLKQDPSVYMNELIKTESRISGFAERDIGEPKTVVDVKRPFKNDPRFWWRT